MYNPQSIKDMMNTSKYTCWVLRMRNDKHSPARPIHKYEPREKKSDDANMDESIHALERQLEIFGHNREAWFEITLKDIKSSTENNGDLIGPIEFQYAPATAPVPLAGVTQAGNSGPGFKSWEDYMDGKLELQSLRNELNMDKVIFKHNTDREWEKIREAQAELKEAAKKYASHVEAGKDALESYIPKVIKFMTGKGIAEPERGLEGVAATVEARTATEQVIDSIYENMIDNIDDETQARNTGFIVQRMIENPEHMPFYLKVKETASKEQEGN